MFIVVRHGNTFEADEQPRRIGARTDLPLTAKGVEQARALGRRTRLCGLRLVPIVEQVEVKRLVRRLVSLLKYIILTYKREKYVIIVVVTLFQKGLFCLT